MSKSIKVRCPVCDGWHGLRFEERLMAFIECPTDKQYIKIEPQKHELIWPPQKEHPDDV